MPRKKKTASSALPPTLRTPIVRVPVEPGVQSPGDLVALTVNQNLHIPQEWLEKMLLLLDHYRIARDDPERWFALAFALALDHVDGMKIAPIQNTAGAPRVWDPMTLAKLYFEVDDIGQERELSIKESCQAILDDHDRWKYYPKCRCSTLVRRYHEAQSNVFVKVLSRAAQSKGKTGRRIIAEILNDELTTPPVLKIVAGSTGDS